MQMRNVMSQCDFECDGFDDEHLYPMAAEKEFADSQFPLDVRTMKENQCKDVSIQKLIEKTNTNQYTIKKLKECFSVTTTIEF